MMSASLDLACCDNEQKLLNAVHRNNTIAVKKWAAENITDETFLFCQSVHRNTYISPMRTIECLRALFEVTIEPSQRARVATCQLVHSFGAFGYTFFCHTESQQLIDLCSLLLSYGADIDVPFRMDGVERETILACAAGLGKADLVKFLLEKGARVDTPHQGNNFQPFLFAIRGNNVDILQAMLDYGADCSVVTTEKQWRVLHVIAYENQVDEQIMRFCLPMLLSDIDARNSDGMTALHLATKQHDGVRHVQLLLESGAATNIKDSGGKTPLDYAEKHSIDMSKSIMNQQRRCAHNAIVDLAMLIRPLSLPILVCLKIFARLTTLPETKAHFAHDAIPLLHEQWSIVLKLKQRH